MKTNKYYNRLIEIQKQYPELTFNNNGYEYLSPQIREKHKKQIKEIEEILSKTVGGFREFNNFKPRHDGSFCVRLQYDYSWGTSLNSFKGVGYFNIKRFKNYEEKEE